MIKILNYKFDYQDLPTRDKNFNKGNAGWSLIVGGSKHMPGAGLIAAKACLYAGSGKVTLMTDPSNFSGVFSNTPEIILSDYQNPSLDNFQVIAYGCGVDDSFIPTLSRLIDEYPDCYYVIDGTGLDHLSKIKKLPKNLTLTPHPGEAARLLNCSTEEIQKDRPNAIVKICEKYNANVILKGHRTLVKEAYNSVIYLILNGNPAMATPGMGDALSGILAALIAQTPASEISEILAASWHGYLADVLVSKNKRIVTASDLINCLGKYEYIKKTT